MYLVDNFILFKIDNNYFCTKSESKKCLDDLYQFLILIIWKFTYFLSEFCWTVLQELFDVSPLHLTLKSVRIPE